MPSKSKKQSRMMTAACKNTDFADKVGIPKKVACEFHEADKKVRLKRIGKQR